MSISLTVILITIGLMILISIIAHYLCGDINYVPQDVWETFLEIEARQKARLKERQKTIQLEEQLQDYKDLDERFDALTEYLKVEFVKEKVSDGGMYGDTERFYARKKK